MHNSSITTTTTTTGGNISKSKISNLFDWCLQRTKTWRDSITSSHDSIDSGDRSIDLIDCTQSPKKNLLNKIEKAQYLPSNHCQPVDLKANPSYLVPFKPNEQTPSVLYNDDNNNNDDNDNVVDDDENDYLIIVSIFTKNFSNIPERKKNSKHFNIYFIGPSPESNFIHSMDLSFLTFNCWTF